MFYALARFQTESCMNSKREFHAYDFITQACSLFMLHLIFVRILHLNTGQNCLKHVLKNFTLKEITKPSRSTYLAMTSYFASLKMLGSIQIRQIRCYKLALQLS